MSAKTSDVLEKFAQALAKMNADLKRSNAPFQFDFVSWPIQNPDETVSADLRPDPLAFVTDGFIPTRAQRELNTLFEKIEAEKKAKRDERKRARRHTPF